ncbi:MAG: heavy metal-binding domain-containing protein [Propionibacteriaceae bacterium]|nr:heavy metal-binding domain-containing protein [Propionibacteriaceae bacterium]
MLIVTTNGIPGYRIEAVLGAVMGMAARSDNAGSNLAAGLRSLGGGENHDLTKAMYESRNEVLSRMWGECLRRGGNAVVGMKFDTSEVGKNVTEVCAYGTAVVATPIPEGQPGATPQSTARAAAANPGPGNWPQFDQGVGAPPPPPGLEEGHRPQATPGQSPDAPETRLNPWADQAHDQGREAPEPSAEVPQPQAAPPGYSPEEHQRRLVQERAGYGHDNSGAPEPAAPSQQTAGVDDAPTNVFGERRGEQGPEQQRPPAGPGGQPPRAVEADDPHQRRPERPQDQRPTSGDSWLDLG